jgi:hypothetical protein
MSIYLYALIACLALLLYGCGFHFNGAETWGPEEIKKFNAHFPSPLEQFTKEGKTEAERKIDSRACGDISPYKTGPNFFKAQYAKKIRDLGLDKNVNENNIEINNNWRIADKELFHDWERCMLNKGYNFIGVCLDNELMREWEACKIRSSRPDDKAP